MDIMNSISSAFLGLVNISITAGWMIPAVIILRLLLKRAPKWIPCLLWGLVGLRLEIPFSLKNIFCLLPSTDTLPTTFSPEEIPRIHTGINSVNNVVNPAMHKAYDKAYLNYLSADFVSVTESNSFVDLLQKIAFAATIVWIAGIALMCAYAVISYWRLHRQVNGAVPLKGNIMLSHNISSPFILGIIKPSIYIPYTLSDKDFSYVIAHEKAHLRRKDHIIKPIAFAVLTVYWFNPLVWIAYIMLCRDIELACDEKVIKDMKISNRKSYSYALLNCSTGKQIAAVSPLAFGEVGVKSRIINVKKYKRPAKWVVIISFVLLFAMGTCFLTAPVKGDSPLYNSFSQQTSKQSSEHAINLTKPDYDILSVYDNCNNQDLPFPDFDGAICNDNCTSLIYGECGYCKSYENVKKGFIEEYVEELKQQGYNCVWKDYPADYSYDTNYCNAYFAYNGSDLIIIAYKQTDSDNNTVEVRIIPRADTYDSNALSAKEAVDIVNNNLTRNSHFGYAIDQTPKGFYEETGCQIFACVETFQDPIIDLYLLSKNSSPYFLLYPGYIWLSDIDNDGEEEITTIGILGSGTYSFQLESYSYKKRILKNKYYSSNIYVQDYDDLLNYDITVEKGKYVFRKNGEIVHSLTEQSR